MKRSHSEVESDDNSEAITNGNCSVRTCNQSAVGKAADSTMLLCQHHLEQDYQKIKRLHQKLQEKVQHISETIPSKELKLQLHAIDAEHDKVTAAFSKIHQSITNWCDMMCKSLKTRSTALANYLQIMQNLQQCDTDAACAIDSGDFTKVFELAKEMELMLVSVNEYFDSYGGLYRLRRCLDASTWRAFGDLLGGVNDLEVHIDSHMRSVNELNLSADDRQSITKASAVCNPIDRVIDLDFMVTWITCCTKTDGFVGDQHDCIRPSSQVGNEDRIQLTPPLIFIAHDSTEPADYLSVISLDGSLKLKCRCDLDWKMMKRGIHCNNHSQQLYIVQVQSVTITDLSGSVITVINNDVMDDAIGCLCGVHGSGDKVFVVDKMHGKLLEVNKEKTGLTVVADITNFHSGGCSFTGLAHQQDTICITDGDKLNLHRLCLITNQVIATYPTQTAQNYQIGIPLDVALDKRGVAYISDFDNHVVNVMLNSGELVQQLGAFGEPGKAFGKFNGPCGLRLLEVNDGSTYLLVADCLNKRIRIFKRH